MDTICAAIRPENRPTPGTAGPWSADVIVMSHIPLTQRLVRPLP
jgi:hypothetical protein